MDTAMSQQNLEEMLDTVVREVTESTAGIRLYHDTQPPAGDLCTIYISFQKGLRSSLSLCAEAAMLKRMTQNFIQSEDVTLQDLEDFSKEYFNVVCGRVAAILFKTTKLAARFSVPDFYQGRYSPEGFRDQFVLTYSSDQRENAQLTHHVPRRDEDAVTATTTLT